MALYSGTSLQGTSWDLSLVPYTVEPLYKGQVGDLSLVPYTVEPLYKGQVGDLSLVPYTVEPLYKGQVGDRSLSSSQRYQMHYHYRKWNLGVVTCPLFRGLI